MRARALLAVCALSLSFATTPARAAATQLGPPFANSSEFTYCGWAAIATGCAAHSSASKTGALSTDIHLVSPGGGKVPWYADAQTDASISTPVYRLTRSVRSLTFSVAFHVSSASITLKDLETGLEHQGVYNPYHFLYASLFANASHDGCGFCGGGNSMEVVGRRYPGAVQVSNKDYVLEFTMINCTNDVLGWATQRCVRSDIPPGDIHVDAGISMTNWQYPSAGDDTGRIVATVTGVTVE
jgi:hypothetical protein